MYLSDSEIQNITCGAALVEREADGLHFYRMTKSQFAVYDERPLTHPRRTATVGVKFLFRTDSRKIELQADLRGQGGTGAFFSFDVYVNGQWKGAWDNFSHMELPRLFPWLKYDLDVASGSIDLGEGVKTVEIHFPWNRPTVIHSVILDDGSFIEPVQNTKKLLVFGDSITQGFYAQRPSKRYIAQLANALDAEEVNKAIGGEQFIPALARCRDDFDPDYIVVAYGTNDWRNAKKEVFQDNCQQFFDCLYGNYPKAQVFAITPIWRYNLDEQTNFESIFEIEEHIQKVTKDMPNMTVISGFDFVPHSVDYFADEGLHPNDAGFDHYFNNLYAQIKKYL